LNFKGEQSYFATNVIDTVIQMRKNTDHSTNGSDQIFLFNYI